LGIKKGGFFLLSIDQRFRELHAPFTPHYHFGLFLKSFNPGKKAAQKDLSLGTRYGSFKR